MDNFAEMVSRSLTRLLPVLASLLLTSRHKNSVYEKYFGEHKPARSCVAVKELPKGVPVEVEAIALA